MPAATDFSPDQQYHAQTISAVNSLELEAQIQSIQTELIAEHQHTLDPELWNNQERAKTVNSKISQLKKALEQSNRLLQLAADLDFLASEIKNGESAYVNDYQQILLTLTAEVEEYKLKRFLSGKLDKFNAVISIFAGQGGTEAHDWTEILLRMYLRYFEKQGWTSEIIEKTPGTEAGISSVSVRVAGDYAYGYLKVEHGTHRLVRISPFNAQGLRQTSFAGVEVVPVVSGDANVEIKPEDIDFSAVRSGGAGGQNVNKVATSVRIRHIPTGILVSSSNERSQLQNKELAMELLRGKLALLEEEKRQNLISSEGGKSFSASWGSQIRNYVLHPYKLVKDLRTKVETDQVEDVLDGKLQEFINAGVKYLAKLASNG